MDMVFKGMIFSKPYESFLFESVELLSFLGIRIIDQITFCFIFSIMSSFFVAWGSSCLGFF